LSARDRELLLADLDEAFAAEAGRGGAHASLRYLANGLHAAWTRRGDTTPLYSTGSLTMGIGQDLRYAVRNLFKHRGFALVALLTLALGIGANTAVFSVISHVLLAPLPYREPDRVVDIWSQWKGFDKTWVSDADAIDYQTRVTAFESAGAWSGGHVNITGDGDPVRVGAAEVTPGLFEVFGVSPIIGRTFTAADAEPAQVNVAILSHEMWEQRYGGAPDILEHTLLLNGARVQIIGVMPKTFQLPTDYVVDAEEPTRLWLPYKLDPTNRGSHGLNAAARLKPGATVASANAELKALAATLVAEKAYPKEMGFHAFALTTTDEAVGAVRPALLLVVAAVAFLLLIACTNVANLLLVRADARTREIALRTALGADRWRVIRQLITEGVVLAAGSAVAGIGLAWIALRVLVASAGSQLPRLSTVALDARVLGFATLVTIVTLLLFSAVPALRTAKVDLVDALKDGSQSASSGVRKQRLRSALVIAEMALAVVMLTGAGLMIRSVWSLQHIDLGFNPDRVLTMRLSLPETTYDTPEKSVNFFAQLVQRVRALPNVERAGLLRLVPLAQNIGDSGLTIEGYTPPPGVGAPADWQIASAGGPEALGERLVTGRWLTDADTIGAEDVALINEAMAEKYWSGRNALGGRFRMGNNHERPWVTVVGIVANVRHNGIEAPIKAKFYRPVGQFHQSTGNPARNMTLVIKTKGDPLALVQPTREQIHALDASLPIAAVQSMQRIVDQAIATPRLTSWLLSVFAALALALAAVGIYGVLSYVVSQRRQDIGIRMAIGADRAQVLGMVLRNGLTLTATGLAVGLAFSAALSKVIESMLHDVQPFDPVTFFLVAVVLMVAATCACLLPALRATRVNPVSALRGE
jgi:putative ABC transport system permease protein